MILTVDIGNTTICAADMEQDGRGKYTARFTARMDTVPGRSAGAYLAELRELLAETGIRAGAFRGAVLSSVVPALEEQLRGCARTLTGTEPVVITSKSDTGLTIDLAEPDKVGRDRLVDAAGAAALVDGITAHIEAELGEPVTLVMTGGLARYVEPLCAHPHIYDPDVLLKGLALLYERNAGRICGETYKLWVAFLTNIC